MSTYSQTNVQVLINFLVHLFWFNISYAQPTSSPADSASKQTSNIYGPERFTTLDWILSGCILTLLTGIFICCYCCIRRKMQSSKPHSEISMKSGINQSEMVAINNNKVNNNMSKTRPHVSQSFGSLHELPKHIKKDSKAFDAAITGIGLTKKDSTYSPIQNEIIDVELENELHLNETENYEDHEYGSYNADTNRDGYSSLAQQENEQIHKSIIETKPPPLVPPKVPESILNKLEGNNDEQEYENEYLSIEEAKSLKGGNKEKRLNDENFMCVFDMTKHQFYKLPQWKQKNIKKSKGLF